MSNCLNCGRPATCSGSTSNFCSEQCLKLYEDHHASGRNDEFMKLINHLTGKTHDFDENCAVCQAILEFKSKFKSQMAEGWISGVVMEDGYRKITMGCRKKSIYNSLPAEEKKAIEVENKMIDNLRLSKVRILQEEI